MTEALIAAAVNSAVGSRLFQPFAVTVIGGDEIEAKARNGLARRGADFVLLNTSAAMAAGIVRLLS